MIEQSVKIHDKHQAEIKLDYTVDDFDEPKSYDIAAYFFVPVSLGINPSTYSKRDFFNDLLSHIRVKTPSHPLRSLGTATTGPLERLRSAITALVDGPDPHVVSDFEYHLKMFCCIVKSALRDHVHAARSRKRVSDLEDLTTQYLGGVADATRELRALRSRLNTPVIGDKLFAKYLFADEFVSLTVESYTYELLATLALSGPEVAQAHRPALMEVARHEVSYRREQGYQSIPDEGSDNEILVFRKSVLKKYVESVLFLVTRTQREGTAVEQTVYAVAAGLSMIFATLVAFLSQARFGNFSFAFFVALVVSYMFKDRIKEVLRAFFSTRIRRFFFDRRSRIYDDPKSMDRIGVCRESFDFVAEGRLPPAVWRLRDRDHITEIENGWMGEMVMQYRKRITLFPDWFRRARENYRIDGVNEIMRVSFAKFLPRMDDPRKPIWVADDAGCRQAAAERVYHVNLIIECRFDGASEYSRFRVVLNKDGIKRIEPVLAEHPTHRVPARERHEDVAR
jgi:hypothetical protein